jgi:hypothetical protein
MCTLYLCFIKYLYFEDIIRLQLGKVESRYYHKWPYLRKAYMYNLV